jgi:hypothetical protein
MHIHYSDSVLLTIQHEICTILGNNGILSRVLKFLHMTETKVPVESSYALYLHGLDPFFTRHYDNT